MVQEAFVVASERWPETGLPPNPGGWLTTTARNRAIDRLRREAPAMTVTPKPHCSTTSDEPVEPASDVTDDRLRLIFTCCHPALAPSAQIALTLRLLGGLETPTSPVRSSCPRRRWRSGSCARSRRSATRRSRTGCRATPSFRTACRSVLAVIYLVFNEGYTATDGDVLDPRRPLCRGDSSRTTARRRSCPTNPRCFGLLALLLLDRVTTRRRGLPPTARWCCSPTKTGRCWDRELIDEGQAIVRRCLRRNTPGPYQIQAAINAVHSDAATAADDRLAADSALYDQLLRVAPSPVVALNRAVALAEVRRTLGLR